MRLEKFGIEAELRDELLQRHVEGFFVALRELQGDNALVLSTPEQNGNFVRAACRSGILNTVEEEDVGGMAPKAVAWLAAELDDHVSEALIIDPE